MPAAPKRRSQPNVARSVRHRSITARAATNPGSTATATGRGEKAAAQRSIGDAIAAVPHAEGGAGGGVAPRSGAAGAPEPGGEGSPSCAELRELARAGEGHGEEGESGEEAAVAPLRAGGLVE